MNRKGAWSDPAPGPGSWKLWHAGLGAQGVREGRECVPSEREEPGDFPPLCRLRAPRAVPHARVASQILALGCAGFLVLCQGRVGDTPHTPDPPIPRSPNARAVLSLQCCSQRSHPLDSRWVPRFSQHPPHESPQMPGAVPSPGISPRSLWLDPVNEIIRVGSSDGGEDRIITQFWVRCRPLPTRVLHPGQGSAAQRKGRGLAHGIEALTNGQTPSQAGCEA